MGNYPEPKIKKLGGAGSAVDPLGQKWAKGTEF
jgi:hypothetical protein